MGRIWRHLRAMPDRERARLFAIISASVIGGILYALGGLSLYLRATYLQVTPTATAIQNLTEVAPLGEEAATLYPTLTPTQFVSGPAEGPTPTLYPTMTPQPGG